MAQTETLFCRDQGDPANPAVVLLHSGGMTGAEWQPQLQPLAEHFRVLAPDQPGHGRSPLTENKASIGANGRAVLALLDRLDIDRASVVGSSMGGATALWLTVHHPDRVAKLVLYRASYAKNSATFAATRELADPDYWRRLGLERWMSEQHLPQGGPDAWKKVIAQVAERHDPDDTDHRHDLDALAAIDQPTLIVAGDRDPLVPLEQIMKLYRALPNAGLWLLPYTTHITATNTWRADAFTVELLRFLQNRGVVKSQA